MKVIHIDSEYGWRGGQQQAAYLFKAMVKQGFETILFCQPDSKFENFCREKKLPHQGMRMYGEIDILAGLKIAKFAKKNGFQIIHAHSAHAQMTAIWAKMFYRKLKIIGARRVDFHIRKNIFSQLKYKSEFVDKIVCISNGIKKVLLEDKVPEKKLITIHSGIDIHKFDKEKPYKDFREKYNIPKENFIVGTVAALVGHKDYPNLLNAVKFVIEKDKNITFISLGSGKDEKEIKELHEELKLGDSFKFLGFRTNVGSYLKQFDLFVMASKKEGLGTSILDAQSVGLAVVGCKTGGIPEAVHNNKNGILVPPRNHKKLAEAILKIKNDEQLRKIYSEQAKIDVLEFDIQKTIENNIALYEQLISEK